jgi:hypothetical protein
MFDHLIHCKDVCKCHNVHSPITIINGKIWFNLKKKNNSENEAG